MECRIAKGEFLRGLRIAQGVADRKATMPILANVLLRTVGKERLMVAATDLAVAASAEIPAAIAAEGATTVSAKMLHEIVGSMAGDEVALKLDAGFLHVSAGKARFKLVALPAVNFPKLPDHREVAMVDVDAAQLGALIDRTMFSISHDESRYHLNAVLIEADGKLVRMVSTDGHRMSKAERPISGLKLAAGILVPKKGLAEIRRLVDGAPTCRFGATAKEAFVAVGTTVLAVTLLETGFPPYGQVIPKDNAIKITIDRQAVIDALKRTAVMASETRGVRLVLTDAGMRLTAENPDLGDVSEDLEVAYFGAEARVCFNAKYVLELLGVMAADQVTLELGETLAPMVFAPADEDYVGVVMPMREST